MAAAAPAVPVDPVAAVIPAVSSYLNQERWNGNIKVVWDTFTGSGTTKPGNNGTGVTAVTLNSTAVTQQDSNTTGAASGAALSSYYFFRKQQE